MPYFVLVFFLGASIGSFVNVLIDRSIAGKDWVKARSICDHCRKQLSWYDMIPLFSYWFYGGKSRCCKKPLSLRHPIVEGLFGALFVWWLAIGFLFFRLATAPLSLVQPVFWLTIAILLVIIAMADFLYGVILMMPIWLGIAWVLLYRVVLLSFGAYSPRDFGLMLLYAAGAYCFLWSLRVVTRGRGMGDGDPYLIFLTTLLVGPSRALMAVLLAFVLGAVVGLILIASGVKQRHESMPFGPFIVMGAGAALLWGETLIRLIVS
jgi:prepilin signal peptidase PulO-like enzyme (type II secretory pathway)